MSTTSTPSAARVPPPAGPGDGRRVLLLLFAIFFGGAVIASVLRLSGWQPGGSTNHGTLLEPAVDLRDAPARRPDATPFAWEPAARIWRVAVLAPEDCAGDCRELARGLVLVWELMGHRADQVEILWAGRLPPDLPLPSSFVEVRAPEAWAERLPRTGADDPVPVYVLDPNGFAILHYATGFDIAGLRADLATLLKLR